MDAPEIRKRFLEFFAARGHTVVPSSSLIPDDPTVLLTTAGMQQFKPYYTGEADPMRDFGAKNAASAQKSFRTSDIGEVGDATHLTFFEMLGNFSFGGYFKNETIAYAHEFMTEVLGLNIAFVTIFEGKDGIGVPKDEESAAIWKSLDPKLKVREQGMEDVFWGPTGASGPCGPTTEIYVENTAGEPVEIWNCVFNQFFYPGSREELLSGAAGKKLEPLATPGVDTGMGLERLAMACQRTADIFETDLFASLMALLPDSLGAAKRRIGADHLRAAAFLLADGVRPSNRDRGYVLRRLLRRVLGYGHTATGSGGTALAPHVIDAVIREVIHAYGMFYPELMREAHAIREEVRNEQERFAETVADGIREFRRMGAVDAPGAFKLYETYGLPLELTNDLIRETSRGPGAGIAPDAFQKEFERHQEASRAGQERKFGGHGLLLDTGELRAGSGEELGIVTRLHTATHLLNAALHKVLGDTVAQRGSDITAERTRFDFLFPRKLTGDELAAIESLVNEAIARDLQVACVEMPLEAAKQSGALFAPAGRYPERVKVYRIGEVRDPFSMELCGGPHVTHTGAIGGFRIAKEESSSAGIRRIRGIIAP